MDKMSLGICRLVVVTIILMQWTQAALIEDTETGPNASKLRMQQMGIDVKFLQDNCMCMENICECCFEGSWPQLNISQEFCMLASFVSSDLELQVNATLNGNTVGNFILSGRNPPPLCFPVPFPIPIPLSICIRVKDIYPEDKNLHFCVDMMLRFAGFDFLTLPLSCQWIGAGGIQPADQIN